MRPAHLHNEARSPSYDFTNAIEKSNVYDTGRSSSVHELNSSL